MSVVWCGIPFINVSPIRVCPRFFHSVCLSSFSMSRKCGLLERTHSQSPALGLTRFVIAVAAPCFCVVILKCFLFISQFEFEFLTKKIKNRVNVGRRISCDFQYSCDFSSYLSFQSLSVPQFCLVCVCVGLCMCVSVCVCMYACVCVCVLIH